MATSFNVLGMVGIMKVRVPAARDRHELLLGARLRAEAQALERHGLLPEEYQRYAGELDTVPVGINPERSILTMMDDMRGFGDLCFQMGFEVMHNGTGLPFITSDNPVCLYDPRVQAGRRTPYSWEGEAELICPLDPWTLLRGSSRLRPVNQVVRHGEITDRGSVARINNTLSRFAYGLAVGHDRSSDTVIALHADRCPTVAIRIVQKPKGADIVWRHAFGPRPQLSPFIDTPEKAERLELEMATQKAEPPKTGRAT